MERASAKDTSLAERMIKRMEKIKLPVNELLCGLAEECSELAQAALKLRRSYDQTNPTPVDTDTAFEKLCEEIADVLLYIEQITGPMPYVQEIKGIKMKRWQNRLNEKGEE